MRLGSMQVKITWQPSAAFPAALPQLRASHLPLPVLARRCAVCIIFPLTPFRWAASGATRRHGSVHILHFGIPGGCQSELWGEWRNSPGGQTFPSIPGENLPSLAWKWRYVELETGFTQQRCFYLRLRFVEQKAPSLWVIQEQSSCPSSAPGKRQCHL